MRQAINGRDCLIICTLCAGFGVLISWALFYRWGSAPAAEPVKYSDWFQAIGSILSVLVAAAVPTAIFVSERRKAEKREQARARCVFALSLDLLTNQIFEIQNDYFMLHKRQRDPGLIDSIMENTTVLQQVREALTVGHEFPELANQLVDFVLKLDAAHSDAIATKNNFLTDWIKGGDPCHLLKSINAAEESGSILRDSIALLMHKKSLH